YGVFVAWPLVQAFWLSLFRWRGVSEHKDFVGADNFAQLSHDEAFWQSAAHNLLLLAGVGVGALCTGLLVAHWLHAGGWLARTMRGVYLFPQTISLVVVAILWTFLYNPAYGLISSGLSKLGLSSMDHVWLGDPKTALVAVGIAFLWYIAGFYI